MQDATSKECGLHSGNIVTSAAEQGGEEAQKDLWPSGPVQALNHQQLERLADGHRDQDTLVVLYAPWCQFTQVRASWGHCPRGWNFYMERFYGSGRSLGST
jgi:adenylyl-sulfate reductase (glutathione)